jgi:hypothetical protein
MPAPPTCSISPIAGRPSSVYLTARTQQPQVACVIACEEATKGFYFYFQASFADTAGSSEGEQAAAFQKSPDFGKLADAVHESGELYGLLVEDIGWAGSQRWKVVVQVGVT